MELSARTLLRIEEVSARTGVPVPTLRWWRHNGTGPESFKLGRRVVYEQADVQAWIAAQRRGGIGPGAA